jgi:hypothetical protein
MDVIEVTRRQDEVMEAFEARLAGAAGVRNAADGALVGLVVEALAEKWWEGWGIHTPVQWLMWRAGVSRTTARQVVRLAARAEELPTTLRLLFEGRLSLDQAAVIARFTPADHEASVCELAVYATVSQIVTATRTYGFDTETPIRTREAPERHVSFGSDEDGQWWGRIRLAADEGKIVEEALKATRDHLHDVARARAQKAAEAEGRPAKGTDAQLGVPRIGWADALVGMAHSALGTKAKGAETSTRTAVHLHLERPVAGAGEAWRAELHGGPALPDGLRRYLLCDCDIEIVWTEDGIPVTTSRTQRTPPRRIRRLVEKRDGYRCRIPGCDQTLWLEVHHIVHWEDDGETVTWNLCCLCGHHHRLHHQGLLGITGNADRADGLVFTNQYGLVLDRAGQPRAPVPGEMPDVAAYECPSGERLQKRWVSFNKTRTSPPTASPARQPAA